MLASPAHQCLKSPTPKTKKYFFFSFLVHVDFTRGVNSCYFVLFVSTCLLIVSETLNTNTTYLLIVLETLNTNPTCLHEIDPVYTKLTHLH